MDRSYSDFTVEGAVRIVRACLEAQQPQMIVPALLDRRSPESVVAELAAARPTIQPASTIPAAAASTFAGPTPAERDALAAALKKRFAAMAGKPAS